MAPGRKPEYHRETVPYYKSSAWQVSVLSLLPLLLHTTVTVVGCHARLQLFEDRPATLHDRAAASSKTTGAANVDCICRRLKRGEARR